MKIIAYELDGKVILQTFVNPSAEVDFDHIVLTHVPSEPQESWIIENGEIKIDQQKLIEFNRSRIPPLTRRQFKLTLLENDLLQTVEDAIAAIEDVKLRTRIQIEYTEAEKFERHSDSVKYMLSLLHLSVDQVDELWLEALKY